MTQTWRTLVLFYPVLDARYGSGPGRLHARRVMGRQERDVVEAVVASLPATVAAWRDGVVCLKPNCPRSMTRPRSRRPGRSTEAPFGQSYAEYHDGLAGVLPAARTWAPWYGDWMTGRLRRIEPVEHDRHDARAVVASIAVVTSGILPPCSSTTH